MGIYYPITTNIFYLQIDSECQNAKKTFINQIWYGNCLIIKKI